MKIFLVAFVATFFQQALAGVIEQPVINIGDTWVYHDTIARKPNPMVDMKPGKLVATRSDAEKIELTFVPTDPATPNKIQRTNPDWSTSKTVNDVTEYSFHPLSFPLWVGKKWSSSSVSKHRGPLTLGKLKEQIYTYTFIDEIVGQEEIEVPAGKFLALKIVDEQTIVRVENTLAVNVSEPVGAEIVLDTVTSPAKVLKVVTLWYVPEVKRWAKLYREEFIGRKIRHLTELQSFAPAK